MGCSGKKKGKGGGKGRGARIVVVLSAAFIGATFCGCTANDIAKLQNPVLVNGIATGTKAGCVQAAEADCKKAKAALDVLNVSIPQLEACREGLTEGLNAADPNCLK